MIPLSHLTRGPILAHLFMTLTLSLQADTSILLQTLAAIETGAKTNVQEKADFKIGKDGEISRYQILPGEWEKYKGTFKGFDATDPTIAFRVAERILLGRVTKFKSIHGRDPTPLEVYVLWHRPQEAYSGKVKARTKERATRFQNLYFTYLADKTKQ
jgi:hypothetical protein